MEWMRAHADRCSASEPAVKGPGGAFCTHGPLSLDTGGDAVADGTQTLHGVDADVPVEVPPGAFYVDFVDGGMQGPATITVVQPVRAIPTVSEWGMVMMGLLLLTFGTLGLKRRRSHGHCPGR